MTPIRLLDPFLPEKRLFSARSIRGQDPSEVDKKRGSRAQDKGVPGAPHYLRNPISNRLWQGSTAVSNECAFRLSLDKDALESGNCGVSGRRVAAQKKPAKKAGQLRALRLCD